MKNFAEYLADYVEERHISWRKAAQLCQVDRTLLSRYASGQKLPESMEKVLQIAQGLGMSQRQIEEFQISYQISKGGAYQYMVLGLLSQVFCGQFFQHKPVLPMEQAAEIPQAPFLKRLYGKEVTAVLDPVFFLKKESWQKVERIPDRVKDRSYILVYVTEPNEAMSDYVKKLSQETELPVIHGSLD